jgi:hypothetical protein
MAVAAQSRRRPQAKTRYGEPIHFLVSIRECSGYREITGKVVVERPSTAHDDGRKIMGSASDYDTPNYGISFEVTAWKDRLADPENTPVRFMLDDIGWAPPYSGPINLREAERALKPLRDLSKSLGREYAENGSADTFGTFLLRILKALKLDAARWSDEAKDFITMTPVEAKAWIDHTIKEWIDQARA